MSAIDTNELDDTKIIRVGSRKSEVNIISATTNHTNPNILTRNLFLLFQLALVQTKHVIAQLRLLNPKQKFEIRTIEF